MSMPAFIFISSIPILRERVTLLKVSAVALQVGGVVMVALGKDPCTSGGGSGGSPNSTNHSSAGILLSPNENSCTDRNTVFGYVVRWFLLILKYVRKVIQFSPFQILLNLKYYLIGMPVLNICYGLRLFLLNTYSWNGNCCS